MIEPIETERLLIGAFTPRGPVVEHCFPSDRENLHQPYEPERAAYYRQYPVSGGGYRAITLKSNGQVIGRVGLTPRRMFTPPEVEICYALVESARGLGYMTEAAAALLQYGVTELGLPRVYARIQPGNTKSQAVAQRSGLEVIRMPYAYHSLCAYANQGRYP